jgi:DDE superfamily endonuclease
MQKSTEINEEVILNHSKKYFGFLRLETFHCLFKLDPNVVAYLLNATEQKNSAIRFRIRNLLLTLFQLKHYLPIRSACIIFGLEKTQFRDIFDKEVIFYYNSFKSFIDIDNRHFGNDDCAKRFPNTYIVVDTTEVSLETKERSTFSGKQKDFTLKYQTIVGAVTGEILGIHGPEKGPTADCKIYVKSGLANFLNNVNEFCLADKGYVGNDRAIHPHKKKKGQKNVPFNDEEKAFNKDVSHFRIKVENVNSFLKDWAILSNTYRGTTKTHQYVFGLCCVFINIAKKFR